MQLSYLLIDDSLRKWKGVKPSGDVAMSQSSISSFCMKIYCMCALSLYVPEWNGHN